MKKMSIRLASILCALMMLLPMQVFAYTEHTGVTVKNAIVRDKAGTDGNSIAGLDEGTSVKIINEDKDKKGTTWYQIQLNDTTGYVRHDLVKITDDAPQDNQEANDTPEDNQGNQEAQDNPGDGDYAQRAGTITSSDPANVRKSASTKADKVGTAEQGLVVNVIGEDLDDSGNVWYQINFLDASGKDVTGYVRYDLISVEEPQVAEEIVEEIVEEPEQEVIVEEPAQKPEYEMVLTDDEEGNQVWYLYNNAQGTRQKLSTLMEAAEGNISGAAKGSASLTLQIAVIAMAVIIVILVAVVVILAFKIHDLNYEYEDYDDDEDEDDEDEDDEDEEDEDEEDEDDEPVRKSKGVIAGRKSKKASKKSRYEDDEDDDDDDEDDEEEVKPAKKKAPRQSKNFLVDDDEFEFEFLNMDDK